MLTASDIKKKSKVAQHDLLRKEAAAEARTMEAQMATLARSQLEAADRIEKLAVSSGLTQRAVADLTFTLHEQRNASQYPQAVRRVGSLQRSSTMTGSTSSNLLLTQAQLTRRSSALTKTSIGSSRMLIPPGSLHGIGSLRRFTPP